MWDATPEKRASCERMDQTMGANITHDHNEMKGMGMNPMNPATRAVSRSSPNSSTPKSFVESPTMTITALHRPELTLSSQDSQPVQRKKTGAGALEIGRAKYPLAALVSCSDSKAPPELLLERGLGDLFIVHNVRNTIDTVAMMGTTRSPASGWKVKTNERNSLGRCPALRNLQV